MGLLKALLKVTLLLTLAAAAAGVVYVVKRGKDDRPLSYDDWPDVPRNPAA